MFHPTLTQEEAEQVVRTSAAFAEGRKFGPDDITQALVEAAVTFLEDWDGDFEYLAAMHSRLANECNLSNGQWAGVLNCYAKTLRQPQAFEGVPLPNGFYTVHLPGDKAVTIRVKDHWEKAQAGTQALAYLCGPVNTSNYKGFGFLKGGRYFPWLRFKDHAPFTRAVEYLLGEGWRHAGVAYAMESGNCCFCNKLLTGEESIKRHYGPCCAKKHNLPWGGSE